MDRNSGQRFRHTHRKQWPVGLGIPHRREWSEYGRSVLHRRNQRSKRRPVWLNPSHTGTWDLCPAGQRFGWSDLLASRKKVTVGSFPARRPLWECGSLPVVPAPNEAAGSEVGGLPPSLGRSLPRRFLAGLLRPGSANPQTKASPGKPARTHGHDWFSFFRAETNSVAASATNSATPSHGATRKFGI
jgi:hypothetical protein